MQKANTNSGGFGGGRNQDRGPRTFIRKEDAVWDRGGFRGAAGAGFQGDMTSGDGGANRSVSIWHPVLLGPVVLTVSQL